MPRSHYKHIDDLAILTFKINIPNLEIDVRIFKKTMGDTKADLVHANPIEEQNWRTYNI